MRNAVSKVDGNRMRPARERFWPHSTAAYYRSDDVHDASFNRRLRDIRPDRVEITVKCVDAVYMRQDVEKGFYTWEHLASLPVCTAPKLKVSERLAELCRQAAREGNELRCDAWEQARAVVTPALGDTEISTTGVPTTSGEEYVDGAGALAIALYMLARKRATAVSAITRQDIEELAGPQGGAAIGKPKMEEGWTSRLESLGHRTDDPDDPVMVRWRALCYNHPEPHPDNPDASTYRVGHAGETGLRLLLSPFNRERIRFIGR